MGTPRIRQRKGNMRLLLLTCGFPVIPAQEMKPVLINSDSRCLEFRTGPLPCGNVDAPLPAADPGAAPGFSITCPHPFSIFLWRRLDLLWHGRIVHTEPQYCWKRQLPALLLSRFIAIGQVLSLPCFSWGSSQCLQSLDKPWLLSSCSASGLASVFISPGVLALVLSHREVSAGCRPSSWHCSHPSS